LYQLIFSKKIAIVLLIILLSLLPIGIIWETWRQTAIFQGVYFADRARAFADEIVKEKKLSPDNALAVLGIPNSRRSGFLFFFNSHPNDLILQPGQEITVRFIDNLLTGSGDTQPDLQIFGQGNINTPIRVEISKDRSQWLSLGEISPSAAIDIDRFGVRKEDFFAYVRLIYPDLGSNTLASPVYIDAIGAISSVSLDNLPNREQLIYNPVLYPLFIAFLVIALIYCLLKRFKLPLTPSDP
jgi:hypothetical protein